MLEELRKKTWPKAATRVPTEMTGKRPTAVTRQRSQAPVSVRPAPTSSLMSARDSYRKA